MSAALILGRSRRKILIFDKGNQRNKLARQMHGYLSRDGIAPEDFREAALKDLDKYYITLQKTTVADVTIENELFRVLDEEENVHYSRRLLVATGVVDNLPDLPNLKDFYGISIHHCPFCDGWEICDKKFTVFGKGTKVAHAAMSLYHWSKDLTIITNGKSRIPKTEMAKLDAKHIQVIEKKIKGLEGRKGWLKGIRFEDDSIEDCEAMFFATGYHAHWKVPEKLNCRYKKKGEIWVDRNQQSSIKGLYVAGDAAWDMKLVIIAAADGARAGVAIHNSLYKEDSGL